MKCRSQAWLSLTFHVEMQYLQDNQNIHLERINSPICRRSDFACRNVAVNSYVANARELIYFSKTNDDAKCFSRNENDKRIITSAGFVSTFSREKIALYRQRQNIVPTCKSRGKKRARETCSSKAESSSQCVMSNVIQKARNWAPVSIKFHAERGEWITFLSLFIGHGRSVIESTRKSNHAHRRHRKGEKGQKTPEHEYIFARENCPCSRSRVRNWWRGWFRVSLHSQRKRSKRQTFPSVYRASAGEKYVFHFRRGTEIEQVPRQGGFANYLLHRGVIYIANLCIARVKNGDVRKCGEFRAVIDRG